MSEEVVYVILIVLLVLAFLIAWSHWCNNRTANELQIAYLCAIESLVT